MTVCVAVISESNRVIGVSDRMLSTSEIAFEPSTSKVRWVTNAIFVMVAGDAALQSEILAAVQADVEQYVAAPGAEWLTVKQVADLYLLHWNEVKRRRAESALLAPLGLTSATFLCGHSLDAGVVDRLVNALIGYALPRVEVIVAGMDRTGPHIWAVEDGMTRCEDGVGFASIGAGRRHAESQMMIGKHHPSAELPQALVLAHLAKKRAEISPSVGSGTDMVISGPQLGQNMPLAEPHILQLDKHFRQLVTGENKALQKGQQAFRSYLTSLVTAAEVPQQSAGEQGAMHE